MFIAHSVVLKHFTFTLPGTAGYLESIGLRGFLAYVVFALEAIGGVLLVLGIRTREVSDALFPILVGAFWVHAGSGWLFSNAGGGWEYPLYLIVLSGAQVLLGEWAFALSRNTCWTSLRVAAPSTSWFVSIIQGRNHHLSVGRGLHACHIHPSTLDHIKRGLFGRNAGAPVVVQSILSLQ